MLKMLSILEFMALYNLTIKYYCLNKPLLLTFYYFNHILLLTNWLSIVKILHFNFNS